MPDNTNAARSPIHQRAILQMWAYLLELESLTGRHYDATPFLVSALEYEQEPGPEEPENCQECLSELLDQITAIDEHARAEHPELQRQLQGLSDRLDNDVETIIKQLEAPANQYLQAIHAAFVEHGVGHVPVVSFVKRALAERLRDRKKLLRWLRTSEGQAYLRKKRLLQQRPHHKDLEKAKTSKLSHKVYKY